VTSKRKICVVTGTRAEYGLLRNLIRILNDSDDFELFLVVTGMHLSEKFGKTFREIEDDGIPISEKIDLNLIDDSPSSLSKSTSLGLTGFGDFFESSKPDLLLVLGDRYEILSAVIAAMFERIPIAHIHGGELTEGLIDEAIRHSITKFSHIHFTSTDEYKKRVIQLGENPELVFNVGGMGVDAIKIIDLIAKEELEDSLNIKFRKRNLLITFHPVTLEHSTSGDQMSELIEALYAQEDTSLIFTMPNADTDGRVIFKLIEDFVSKNHHAYAFKSMGQVKYLSCIPHVDAVIGNSSSGLTEVPTFKKPTINIGDRQKGRVMAKSVINCAPICSDIENSIRMIYEKDFLNSLNEIKNPYGEGGSSDKIVQKLSSIDFDSLLKKNFYDL
tara:strand:+ start:72 stop:1232 length:1161 start_codon:yes stop_codon:yes gene_type:complete